MNTNTNTNQASEPKASEQAKPTDARIVAAATNYLKVDSNAIDRQREACQRLAKADEASKASGKAKAEAAESARFVTGNGVSRAMPKGSYSKLCKVGRATDDQFLAFLMACDTPSIDKFYNWLPKAEHLSKPKADRKPSAPKAEPKASPEPVAPAKLSDADCPKIAADVLAGLRTRGASQLQVSMIIDEMIRLTTPVASVKAA